MAKVTWQGSNGASGNDWNLASNWSTGVVPQPGDDVVIPAGTTLPVELTGSTANVGSVTVNNGASADLTGHLTVTGDFVANGGVAIDDGFLTEFGGSVLTIGGMLTVGAGFSIGNRAQTSATKVTAASLTNTSSIDIAGNSSPLALAELDVASVAGFGGMAGVLTGNINLGIGVGGGGGAGDALLDFVGGGLINTIQGGAVQLSGANAFIASGNATSSNSALAGPLTIAATGTLNLQGGPVITTQALTVAGNVSVDTGFLAPGGSKLTVTGLLTVSGNFSIGRSAMTTSSTTVTAGGLANTGSINLNGDTTDGFQGTLDVGSAAGFGTAGVLTGNVQLTGLSLLDFASGQIATIDHTGTLLIDGTTTFLASGGATSSNSALAGLATMNGFFTLIDGAALTTRSDLSIADGVNFSNLNVDNSGPGGSVLHIGGTLGINSFGGLSVGNGGITAAATVTANAVNFAGTAASSITLIGATKASSGTSQATLTVTSVAGFAKAGILAGGNLSLTGKALLDFTLGGQVTQTVIGATITIDGANAFVASGNAVSSNSALAGLTSLGGNLVLHDGAQIATTGDLNVSDGTHGNQLTIDTGSGLAVGGSLTIAGVGNLAIDTGNLGGSSLTVGGTLSNSGGLQIGNTGISAATTVSATGLVNSGNINLNSKLGIARAVLSLVGPGTAGTAASLNTGAITSNTDGIAIGGGVRLVNGSSGSATGLITAGYAGVVLSNNGALVNYGTVKGTQTGVSLEPAGSATGAGVAVSNYGLLSGAVGIIDGGPSGTSDTVVNHGRVSGTSGAGIMLGGGSDRVDNFGTVSGANGTAVAFGGGGGTVVIEPGAVFSGVLGGLAKGDLIDFAHVSATGFGFAGGALTLFNHGTIVPGATVAVSGTFTPADLALVSDGAGGVEIGMAPLGPVIVGTYYTPILLSNPAINNSATVTATGRVAPTYGDAIIGAAGVPGTVANLGMIAATSPSSVGISLGAGGLIANGTVGFAGGYISGSLAGVKIGSGSATITNAGTITGGSGILIAAGSLATIANAGMIAGTAGILIAAGSLATIANAGMIAGTGGTAVSLAGGTNRLILAPGASFQGKADGGGGNSVVEIAASLAGLGAAGGATGAPDTAAAIYVSLGSVSNFSALQVDPGAATDADGNLSFGTLVNQGQINLLAGDSLVVGTVAGAAAGGTIDLKSGGSVHFTGAVAASQTVLFRPPGGSVAIDHPEQFAAAITQFAATDVIDLPMGTASFQQYVGGVLSLNYNGQAVALQLATTAATPQFQFTPDAQGGTDISVSDTAPCFCRGTRVLTARGEVAVEDLRVGERVVTLSGAEKPIRWIGMGRDLVTRANKLARPVIVRAGALADGVPHRDLHLTHGHALYLDSAIGGALIPVEHLVNHKTIRWDERAQVVEYYHIELEDHDVLLAEGAPAESYHDAGNRAAFQNTRPGSTAARARPTFAAVLHGGEVVEAVWARLLARAGGPAVCDMTADPDLHLVVDGERLEPEMSEGGVYRFLVPRPPNASLLLRSRVGVPSLLGQGRSDHRPLGVAVTQLVIEQEGVAAWLDYDQPQLREAGCYRHEDGFAWTDGDLQLPARFLPPLPAPFTLTVRLEPHPELRYPLPAPAVQAA